MTKILSDDSVLAGGDINGVTNIIVNNATADAITNVLTLSHNTTGTPATSLGTGLLFRGETSTTVNTNMAQIGAYWSTVTHATRASKLGLFTITAAGALTEQVTIDGAGLVGIGTASPTNLLSLGGNSARTFWMERHTTANTAGNNLTITAGGATSGATDKNGGDLVLTSAIATGTGSSNITLRTHPAGTTGTTDTTVTTAMTILGSGYVGIGTASPATLLEIETIPASTNTIVDMLTLDRQTTGTPAAGIGLGIVFNIEDTGGIEEQASIDVALDNATDNTEGASFRFNVNNAGTLTEAMRIVSQAAGVNPFLGIGSTAPRGNLGITNGTENTPGDIIEEFVITAPTSEPTATGSANLVIQSNDAMAADKGGSIGFGARSTTSSTVARFYSGIFGAKENGTSTSLLGYLSFYTRDASAITERLRIDSDGTLKQSTGGRKYVRTATAVSYTVLTSDYYIGVTSTAAARTITLPAAATAAVGRVYIVKDESGAAGTNNITIDGNGDETIDGAATKVINTNYGTSSIICDGSNWFTI